MHEYAHLLFFWNSKTSLIFNETIQLADRNIELKTLRMKYYEQMSFLSKVPEREIAKLVADENKSLGTPEFSERKVGGFADLNENECEQSRVSNILLSYNEFYADLITILYFRDPSYVASSIPSHRLKDGSLDQAFEKNRWKRDFCDPRNDIARYDFKDSSSGETHLALAPSRYEICKLALQDGIYDPNLAYAALRAIDVSMHQIIHNPSYRLVDTSAESPETLAMSIKTINRLFLKNLKIAYSVPEPYLFTDVD